jgi:hypothetical protein
METGGFVYMFSEQNVCSIGIHLQRMYFHWPCMLTNEHILYCKVFKVKLLNIG